MQFAYVRTFITLYSLYGRVDWAA